MRSFLGTPAFNSCLFESSSFRAILCASALFHRRFRIPGSLELSNSHASNPGNHPVIAMKKMNNRDGTPDASKLVNGTDGQYDRNLESWVLNVGDRTLRSCKIWSTGYPHRLRHQSRSRKLRYQSFREVESPLVRSLRALITQTETHPSRVAFPIHMFASMTAELPGLSFSMMLLHFSAI